MSVLFLVLGLLLLVKGADFLVDSASKLAGLLGIPPFIIGLTIVAIGTSAPEATIGIFSAFKAANQITLGDAIGSSIANIALILGITASILPLKVDALVARREIPVSFFVQVGLAIMIFTGLFVSRLEGALLLTGFLIFIFLVLMRASFAIRSKHGKSASKNELPVFLKKESELPGLLQDKKKKKETVPYLLLIFFLGVAGLVLGGNLVVENAVKIAEALGLSKEFIGLTVVALGTSLPELVTCVFAAIKKKEDIAVGNIIGSNIFNVLFVLGLSSLLNPIQVKPEITLDIIAMLASTILLFVPAFFRGRVGRLSGFILIMAYVSYITYKIAALSISARI